MPAPQGRHRRRPMSEINVVPYIDVMLVLLVIFMITAPLLKTGVEVELPQASSKPVESRETEPLVLTVNRQGDFYLNIGDTPDQPLEERELMTLVAAAMRAQADRQVMVRGDRNVDYGRVVHAMAVMQRAGVPNVGLLTESLP